MEYNFKVKIKEQEYDIRFEKNGKEFCINVKFNEQIVASYNNENIKEYCSKILGIQKEYIFEIDGVEVTIVMDYLKGKKKRADIVVGNKLVSSGNEYHSIRNLPAYTNVFVVLDLLWGLLFGAIPIAAALLSMILTVNILKTNMSNVVKVLFSLLVFIAESVLLVLIIFGVRNF